MTGRLNFSSYGSALKEFMKQPNSVVLVDALYGAIAGPLNLKTKRGSNKGQPLTISSGTASDLLTGKVNPNNDVVAGTDSQKVISTIDDYFDSVVIILFYMDRLDDLKLKIVGLIETDKEINLDTKKELLEKSKSSELSVFLAATYLYVLHVDNKNKQPKKKEAIRNIPMASVYFDPVDNKVHFSDRADIPLAKELVPAETDSSHIKYLNALCEAYSDKLKSHITINNIDTCNSKRIRNNFNDQRNYYNSVQTKIRGIREVFDGIEEEYGILKEEAYEGIKETYFDDYDDGFKRLNEVLKKVTNTSLDKSYLVSIKLIGNSERKGLCHVLVNEGYINSWVNIDD